jgi:Novel STAND NTPase 1
MPRVGGPADKLGNRFELTWAVLHGLYCLTTDARITVESIDEDLARGTEFAFRDEGVVHVHQVKRQLSGQYHWTIKALTKHNVWATARHPVSQGRQYHFVSMVSSGELVELTERARESDDLETFSELSLSEAQSALFKELSKDELLGRPDIAWTTLRGMHFEVHDEVQIAKVNQILAGQLLVGAPGRIAALAIGDVLISSMSKSLTGAKLIKALKPYDILPLTAAARATVRQSVSEQAARWQRTIDRELLNPVIQRPETSEIIDALAAERLVLVSGTAGAGKSAVLDAVAKRLIDSGSIVLPLRLDQLDSFDSTLQMGEQLRFGASPVEALAQAAAGRDAVLLIDQLDAVSFASGRTPDNFDAVVDLIDEALSAPGIRVILACRAFDIENDHRIRILSSREDLLRVTVAPLTEEMVNEAVDAMGLDATKLTSSQRELLRTPFNLVLLSGVASNDDALSFESLDALFDDFWSRKRERAVQSRPTLRFNDVVSRVANTMSDRQTLSIPVEVLDDGELIKDAHVLASEHLLAINDNRVGFFHEAFFDYAFARLWMARTDSMVDFLTASEQELFRRAQVRQVLQYLSARDVERFRAEVVTLLRSSEIRFHIQETVLAVVANLAAPEVDDVELMVAIAATHPRWEERLWQQLRRPQWFTQFHAAGYLDRWLDSPDEDMRNLAVNFMGSSIRECPAAVTALLSARRESPHYGAWVRWLVRFADLHDNRELFELLLDAVRDGVFDGEGHDLWLAVHELGTKQPAWAIELLRARLIDHHDALKFGETAKIEALGLRDYGLTQIVRDSAKAKPLLFAQTFVPYLRDVMAATARPQDLGDDPIRDNHFAVRFPEEEADERDLDDALLTATSRALEAAASSSPDSIRDQLDALIADPHDTAQYLLYRAMAAAGETYAEEAAALLGQGGGRLECGYASDSHWVARSLVVAIAPHLSQDSHERLDVLFRDLQNDWENPKWRGTTAFAFISALDESRLTEEGRRKLGEYQRKFGSESPTPPRGVMGGFIGSPIDRPAVELMTDKQWLTAMTKYDEDKTDWNTFTGGARELSHMLQERLKQDPERFAMLALRITPEMHPAYADSILLGLSEAEASDSAAPHVFAAVRHLAALGHSGVDRWIGNALRRYLKDVPIDLVQLILDRALSSADPKDGTPIFQRETKDGRASAGDLRMDGINTARGSLAESLGDLMIQDEDGERTALIAPQLLALAGDPVLSVRTCVAHTVAAALRHARQTAYEAFAVLVEADDALLATDLVQRLMMYIGNKDPDVVTPVIERMLASGDDEVRRAGGVLACRAAIEWDRPELLEQAIAGDANARAGAASMAAHRMTSDNPESSRRASETLMRLMEDDDDAVRQALAEMAPSLRGHALRPHLDLVIALIESQAYVHATPQILLALQEATDRVDDLVLAAAKRFVAVFGKDAGDIRTGAARDAHYISELVVRALAQVRDAAQRSELLDVLDLLLEHGVYGIHEAIAQSERR